MENGKTGGGCQNSKPPEVEPTNKKFDRRDYIGDITAHAPNFKAIGPLGRLA